MYTHLRSLAAIAFVLVSLAACADGIVVQAMGAHMVWNGVQRLIAISDSDRWAWGERTPLAAGTQP